MCAILGFIQFSGDSATARDRALDLSRRMRHRGPDWSGVWIDDQFLLAHERLAIVGIDDGAQPLESPNGKVALAVNGEIYNHRNLRTGLEYDFQTSSDCEVIIPLWIRHGVHFLNDLNGIFSFVIVDSDTGEWLLARDPIGVMPLYYGRDESGCLIVASEMKGLSTVCQTFSEFPPGHYLTKDVDEPVQYYSPKWRSYDATKERAIDVDQLRASLEAAVQRQLMCDVPYGVLLSGGLDSSLIAACAVSQSAKRVETDNQEEAWWPRVHSFAIGLDESPDLRAAAKVAEHLGTVHHGLNFSVQEGLDALRDVIWHLETYDITTIRAATPMYLMARKIKSMGIKMVLSGEGADEVFGGYLYFHKAPSAREFHEENIRKLDMLHMLDCLRANKSMAAWGIEARVPFLDREFLDVAMSFDAEHKRCVGGRMEKHVLREAFRGALPDEILWRQKEQFSDGVGYSWIDSLKKFAESTVTDHQLLKAKYRFPHNTPATKEGYYYREIFEEHYPGGPAADCVPGGKSIACSTQEALKWDPNFASNTDPSGRAVKDVHVAANVESSAD